MIIHCAAFLKSSTSLKQCPSPSKPEFAFIGRSNVGKSSLINMLTNRTRLARTSGTPGKTTTINHYNINDSWYIADLPGYGYAKVPVEKKNNWKDAVEDYILNRRNLIYLFVLLDSRLIPQKIDLDFMEFLGLNQIPFCRIFTKTDKISKASLEKATEHYNTEMYNKWESLPPTFFISATKGTGRDELLNFIDDSINNFSKTT
jgi:GTP-binding protein